jgi:hypothetical protein
MLSQDTTEGAFLSATGFMNPVSSPSSPNREPSAVKGDIVLTPIAATKRIVANEKTFAVVTMELFLMLRCFFISLPSTNPMDKRFPLLIGQVTEKNT